jgi:hypothetical protein
MKHRRVSPPCWARPHCRRPRDQVVELVEVLDRDSSSAASAVAPTHLAVVEALTKGFQHGGGHGTGYAASEVDVLGE